MWSLVGWLVIILGIIFSIAWHELGHLVPAKIFGVKCTQYMIGFGPTVWSKRRGETEYGVKAIPLGGYVRMIGMFPPERQGRRPGALTEMIEQARADSRREIGPEDVDRQFYQRAVSKRLVIMMGGPTMNLILSLVLFTLVFMTFGVVQTSPTVSAVSECALSATENRTQCVSTDPVAPAAAAGVRPGDVILSVNGVTSSKWETLQDEIRASGGKTVPVVVERDGKEVTLQATPLSIQRPTYTVTGNEVKDADGKVVLETVGFLGVSPTRERVKLGLTEVPGALGETLTPVLQSLTHVPEKMVGVVRTITSGGERDPESPMSVVGVGRVGGEVGGMEGPAQAKFASWLLILASLNLALFLFNLIPLLPLDGGHVAGALWEGLRREVARLFNRPDPGPVDVARALPLAYGVAALLIGMSLILVYADIVSPVRLSG